MGFHHDNWTSAYFAHKQSHSFHASHENRNNKMVVRFDERRKEVSSTAIFITSFIQIILFCVVCAINRPTQPPDVRRVFQHVGRYASKTNHNLWFNIIYILEKDFCYSNLMWISDELCLRNRIWNKNEWINAVENPNNTSC